MSSSWLWPVPRRCPVDDAAHTTCTSPDYPDGEKRIVIVQLPARDELLAATRPLIAPPSPDRVVTLQPTETTQATYRGTNRRRRG